MVELIVGLNIGRLYIILYQITKGINRFQPRKLTKMAIVLGKFHGLMICFI
jgi:hypothetical protein